MSTQDSEAPDPTPGFDFRKFIEDNNAAAKKIIAADPKAGIREDLKREVPKRYINVMLVDREAKALKLVITPQLLGIKAQLRKMEKANKQKTPQYIDLRNLEEDLTQAMTKLELKP